jgi:hypothetical protein
MGERKRRRHTVDLTEEIVPVPAAPPPGAVRPPPNIVHEKGWLSFGQSPIVLADLALVAIIARTSRGLHQVFKNVHVLDLYHMKMTGKELEAISRYYRVEKARVGTIYPRNYYDSDEGENPEENRLYSIDHFQKMSCDIGPKAQSSLLHLSTCNEHYMTDLCSVTGCLNLKHLDISCCTFLKDIFRLKTCKKLETLNASHLSRVTRLVFITELKNLRELKLDALQIDVYGEMWELPLLESLRMKHNTQLGPTLFLQPCINLKIVVLDYCEKLDPKTFSHLLSVLPELERLQLTACVLIDDSVVEAVGKYSRKLGTLFIDRCPLITDVAPLAECPKLHTLTLRGTDVRDILPLAKCAALAELDVVYCRISHQNVMDTCKLLPNTRVLHHD